MFYSFYAQSKHKKVWNLGGIFLSDPQWSAAHGVTWTHPWARAPPVLVAAGAALVSLPLSPAASHVNDALASARCPPRDAITAVRFAMCQCPVTVLAVLSVCFARILCVNAGAAWTANDDFMSHNRYVISPDHLLPYQNQGTATATFGSLQSLKLFTKFNDTWNKSTISKLQTAQLWKYHSIKYSLTYDCLYPNKNMFM